MINSRMFSKHSSPDIRIISEVNSPREDRFDINGSGDVKMCANSHNKKVNNFSKCLGKI